MEILSNLEKLKKEIGESPLPIRKLFSEFSELGIFPSPNRYAEDGVSIRMTVRNEPWLEPSVLSTRKIADEIVIVDSSTIDIKDQIKSIRDKIDVPVKYEKTEPDLRYQSKRALELTSKKWILRWDGDFIAYTSGKKDISKLKNLTGGLSSKKYYYMSFPVLVLGSDFFHTSRDWNGLLQREPWFFNYSPFLINEKRPMRILQDKTRKCPPRMIHHPFPLFYEKRKISTPLGIHLRDLKPSFRSKERELTKIWANLTKEEKIEKYDNDYNKFKKMSPEKLWEMMPNSFKERRYNNEFDMFSKFWEMGQNGFSTNELNENVTKFDYEKWGFPSTLEEWLVDELGVEIKNTERFNKKINQYISNFGEKK